MTVAAHFRTPAGAPLVTPATLPTYEIFRVGTGSIATGSTVELGGGWYVVTGEEQLDGSEYTWVIDGDPIVAGQTSTVGRYVADAYSGTERARIESDVVDILADTAAMQPLVDVATSTRAAPGDAMALTPAERTTLAGVVDTTLGASHGVGSWATAVGFSTHTAADVDTLLTANHGAGNWITATGFSTHSAADVDTVLSGTHGPGSWATATGFAVAGDAMTLTAGAETSLLAVFDTAHGVGSWVGAGLTGAQATQLEEVWQFRGLDLANGAELAKAVVGTPGYIRVPFAGTTIDVEVTQVDASTVRLQRQ